MCSVIFDKLTIVKGYLQLNNARKKVDYSMLILQQINEIESILKKIVDDINIE